MTARIQVERRRYRYVAGLAPDWSWRCQCRAGGRLSTWSQALAIGLAHLAEHRRMQAWLAGMHASGSESRSEPPTRPRTREARSSASGPYSEPQTHPSADRPAHYTQEDPVTEIDNKTRAAVMRDLAAEWDGFRTADNLRAEADLLDPPEPELEFEDGDYAMWRRRGTRHLANRNMAGGDVPWRVGFEGYYTDDEVRADFTRIERLRTPADDEVIIKREDAREALDALDAAVWGTRCTGSDCAGCQAGRAQTHLRRALNERGGEPR